MSYFHVRPETIDKDAPILRKLYGFTTFEFTVRLTSLGIGTVMLAIALETLAIFAWYAFYITLNVICAVAIRRLATNKSPSLYLLNVFIELLATVTFMALPIYLWLEADPIMYFASAVLLVGAILNSFSLRSLITPFAIADGVTNSAALLFMGITISIVQTDSTFSWLAPSSAVLGTLYYVVILYDIYHLQRAKQHMADRAIEAQKMEAVGRLTGGVAHDFNNILTVVIGNLDLTREVTDPTEKESLIDDAITGARRASELVAQLLAFSRKSALRAETIDVEPFLAEFVALNARVLPATIAITHKLPPKVSPLQVDPNQLKNVLLNLVINARDAMPDKGSINITAFDTWDGAHMSQTLAPGTYVAVDVTDTGLGIPDDVIGRVFDPFFTTKPVGKGSGLGLSMAKGFAEQSGGDIAILTERGKGTTIRLILPAAPATAET